MYPGCELGTRLVMLGDEILVVSVINYLILSDQWTMHYVLNYKYDSCLVERLRLLSLRPTTEVFRYIVTHITLIFS